MLMQPRKAVWGIALILVGLILLLNKLGVLGWDVWWYLGSLWPLLLVLAGIALLWRRWVLPWGLILLAAGGIIWYLLAGGPVSARLLDSDQLKTETLQVEQAFGSEIKEGELNLRFGAGSLFLGSGKERRLTGSLDFSSGQKPVVDCQVNDNRAVVNIHPGDDSSGPLGRKLLGEYRWDLRLPSGFPWRVDLNVGAASGILDLTNLTLSGFNIQGGACSLRANLGPPASAVSGHLSLGASHITLALPKGTLVRVRWKGGISRHNLEAAGLTAQGKDFVTPGFDESHPHYDLSFEAGATSFDLIWTGVSPSLQV